MRFVSLFLFLSAVSLAAAEIPLTNWSADAGFRSEPVPALHPEKQGAHTSPPIAVKPSARYLLKFCFRGEQGNSFFLDLTEYDANGKALPGTDWKRHRDVFLRPDKGLRKEELEMEMPFDTRPETASFVIRLEKITPGKIYFRDFRLEEQTGRPALDPEPFTEPDTLSMRGPDGILYPDFTRAGVSERRPPSKSFAVRDFGAIPDDAEDDAAGIRKAVDAAAAAGGGVVLLDPGEYLLYGKVFINTDRIVIRGAGRGKTRLVSQPRPSGLGILNVAPGDRIGRNTRLELYFPWKKTAAVTLSAAGKTLLSREIPAQMEAARFDSHEAYLKSVKLKQESGFAVCQADPETGKIILDPKDFFVALPPGKCALTLETIGRDGTKQTLTEEFFVTPEINYSANHSLIHFEGLEYSAPASRMPLATDLKRGGTTVELASDHRMTGSEFVFLAAPLHTEWDKRAHTPLHWGTMRRSAFRIVKREGKRLTLDRPSRIPLFAEEGAYATAFFPIRFCALEGVTIEQRGELQKEFKLNAVSFDHVADCETREIEVIKAGVWPVRFSNALNCAFSDAVLRGAWFPKSLLSYAGFENGTDCLMERIETFDLRHAPLLNWSSSGCVIRDSVFHNSDAQLHSGYCLENLFEQCRIIETTPEFSSYGFAFYSTPFNDGMHGSNGPRNVIYNCDTVSRKSAVYLGGNNSQWRIVYNRFRAESGPGVIARLNCQDSIFAGNVFTLNDSRFPLFFNEYLDNSGNEFRNNLIFGGNGRLTGGVEAAYSATGNRFLPADSEADVPKAPVPSLYLWQKQQKAETQKTD